MKYAKVLNGEVTVGDRIAYSTRFGSFQFMHIGVVDEIAEVTPPYAAIVGEKRYVLKVNVTRSSGSYHKVPRKVTLIEFGRIVKL